MAIDFLFAPEKLIAARKNIVARHQHGGALNFSELTEEQENLVGKLHNASDGMLKATAMSLSERDVKILAGYVPYNYYELNEEKLFTILKYRMNPDACAVLFSQWQESFDNPACNKFLKTMAQSDRNFRKLLADHHIDSNVFIKILDSQNIPLSYDEELVGRHFVDGADFEDKLKYYGVQENSYLDIECKRALLTFCSKADYFNCSENNILDIIRSYDAYMLKKFVLNFMNRLSLAELQIYPAVAGYLRSVIGHRKSRTFFAFFSGVDADTVQQYLDWINIYKINTYFENDDRSRFWKQYRYLNVIKYPISNVVVLEFSGYVAVEFLGDKKGTIYICDKDVFRENFYAHLDTMNNEDLRMYFKVRKEQCLEYRNHSGRWQSHVGNVISKREIAEKIRI